MLKVKTAKEFIAVLVKEGILTYQTIDNNTISSNSSRVKLVNDYTGDLSKSIKQSELEFEKIIAYTILFSVSNRDERGTILDQDPEGNPVPFTDGLLTRSKVLENEIDLSSYIVLDLSNFEETSSTVEYNPVILIPKSSKIVVSYPITEISAVWSIGGTITQSGYVIILVLDPVYTKEK